MKTSTWALLAADLMDQAASEFGNHGCNDMNLNSYGLTKAEQKELVTFMHAKNGDPEETKNSVEALPNTSDFCVMHACAAWLRELAAKETT